MRRFLVTCLGNADAIFSRLWAQLQELGWLGANTVVVVIGDGAEWIWKRAWIFPRCCQILDFWHALEHAWSFARLQYGEGSKRAERWVHQIAEDLRAGKVQKVIARLERLQPSTVEARKCLQELIGYYTSLGRGAGKQARGSMRLFTIPGMDHCAGGAGCDTFDKLSVIDAWVDRGEAPERIVASKFDDGKLQRTRPLCAYPAEARYKGTGDTKDAANFICAGG